MTLSMIVYAIAFIMINPQIVALLTDQGYSPALAASAVGFQGFIDIIAKFVGGALSDRFGREKALTLGVTSFILAIACMTLAGFVTSPLLAYAFAAFLGLANGIAFPTFVAAVADLFQGKHFGSILGVSIIGGYLGGALGAWLGGYLFDVTRAYKLSFLLSTLGMCLAVMLIWKARPSRVRFVRLVEAGVGG
jgi:MFS family permease